MEKKNKVILSDMHNIEFGKYRSSNHVGITLTGCNTKGTQVVVEANLPIWWFEDIARDMWTIIEAKEKEIKELKAALQNKIAE